jgi:hypothetical protein
VRRLHARFDNLIWMKNSEVARYWAARELTRIERADGALQFRAPFACPNFTVRFAAGAPKTAPILKAGADQTPLKEVTGPLKLAPGTWCREGEQITVCVALPKGASTLSLS